MDLQRVYKNVVGIVRRAYKSCMKMRENNVVEKKELNDIVSTIDKAMEEKIVSALKKLYPTHTFVGEEFGCNAGALRIRLAY